MTKLHGFSLTLILLLSQSALAAEQPAMPGPRDRGARIVLGPRNLHEFRELLLEPVADWVSSGRFVARMVSELDFFWIHSSDWNEASRQNRGRFEIDKDGSLISKEKEFKTKGYPFPEIASQFDQLDELKEQYAYQLLWNASYAESSAGRILYDLDIAWVGIQSVVRRSRGVLFRHWNTVQQVSIASPAPEPAAAPEPLFSGSGDLWQKEILQLQSPAVVYGYAQLLWRQRGATEDKSWLYSPVIEKGRGIPSAGRGDKLLDAVLTADDLFVLGSKIQDVHATIVGRKRLLVAFPALTPFLLEAGEESKGEHVARGYHQLLDGSVTAVRWNFETRQFPRLASWLPTSIYLVPREVWLLELWPKNPFYRTGREILVLDKLSGLPVYKLVYTHRGFLERVVVVGWGMAQSKDGSASVPFAGFVLAVDAKGRTATAVSTQQVSLFSDDKAPRLNEMQRLFDISAHGAQAGDETEGIEPGPKKPPEPQL